MITMEDLVSRVGGSVPGDADAREENQLMVTTAPRLRAAMASVLNRRTGHARFRRGPVVAQQQQNTPDQPSASAPAAKMEATAGDRFSASASSSHPSTTLTSVTAGGEGSVSGGYHSLFPSSTTGHTYAAPDWLQASRKCDDRARSENDAAGGKARGGRCHCSKKRKPGVKKVIRVPAISSRNADVPPDDYSWRKYGQKPIKGSPYPRGYYKCSTVCGCPARKHVERDPREPAMLIITYEGDHRHDASSPPDQGNAGGIGAYAVDRSSTEVAHSLRH